MITDLAPVSADSVPVQRFDPDAALPDPSGRPDALRLACALAELPALSATVRCGGPRIGVDVDATGDAWPDGIDIATLVAGGVVNLALTLPDRLGACSWVHLVGLLVGAREHGLDVAWQLPSDRPSWASAEVLQHLGPPSAADDVVRLRWIRQHRYGQLFWRRGPGFVSIVDARTHTRTRYVIDEVPLLELFDALARPCPIDTLHETVRSRLPELVEADLAVCAGGLAVRLPYRLRHWPMPGNQL